MLIVLAPYAYTFERTHLRTAILAIKIIHNFLSNKNFQSCIKALDRIQHNKGDSKASTLIEKEKVVFKIEGLDTEILKIIEFQGGEEAKKQVGILTGWTGKIYSLLEIDGFAGYAPMHRMQNGGFLGSHVDHSYVNEGDLIHVANSIFYAVPKWEDNWQGETVFFDKTGYRKIQEVLPEPNKLVLFTHDSESFHGVNRITCPNDVARVTFYMDYYISKDDLYEFGKKYLKQTGEPFYHFKYLTMFLPLPTENGKIMWNALIKSEFKGYLRNYMQYLSESLLARKSNYMKSAFIRRNALIALIKLFDFINYTIKFCSKLILKPILRAFK